MNVKELLKGLEAPGVQLNTRNLARFTAENGILVTIACGRRRGRIGLPPKLLGLRPDKWTPTNKEFFSGHINMGQLTLVPKEMEDTLSMLESRARRLVQNNSLNGTYMPLAVYATFREEFLAIREEYLNSIEAVAQEWEAIRSSFVTGVTALVGARAKSLLKKDREKMLQSIIASIPTANDYLTSGYMDIKVHAFPTTGVTVEGLAPDLQDSINQTWRDDVVANAVKSIETAMGQVFVQACKISKIYAKTGKMHPRSLSTLAKTAYQVKKLNIFANPMLVVLGDRLSSIADKDDETTEYLVEESILDIVAYSNSTGIVLDMKESPFTKEQFEDMLALRCKFSVASEEE